MLHYMFIFNANTIKIRACVTYEVVPVSARMLISRYFELKMICPGASS